jgi:amino acid transporter
VFSIIKSESVAGAASSRSNNCVVTMITGLIILGLIIDLGGAPNGERLGFRVRIWCTEISRPYSISSSTGNNRAHSTGSGSFQMSTRTAFLVGYRSSSRLHSRSKEWSSSQCMLRKCWFRSRPHPSSSAASETESPRRNIAKAVRRVFYRILVFYVLGILITGMIVPSDDPDLLKGRARCSSRCRVP